MGLPENCLPVGARPYKQEEACACKEVVAMMKNSWDGKAIEFASSQEMKQGIDRLSKLDCLC